MVLLVPSVTSAMRILLMRNPIPVHGVPMVVTNRRSGQQFSPPGLLS
jgi:hypothetical protein